MEILGTIIAEIERVIAEVKDTAIDEFASRVLARPRVFVTGEGRSGYMARAFAMRLMHLGLTVFVVGETTTPAITGDDTLVAVSGSGTTTGTVHVAREAAQQGAVVLAVTADAESALAEVAQHTLVIPAATKWRRAGEEETVQPLGSLFDQCTHIALDGVCLAIAMRKQISNERARQFHANVE